MQARAKGGLTAAHPSTDSFGEHRMAGHGAEPRRVECALFNPISLHNSNLDYGAWRPDCCHVLEGDTRFFRGTSEAPV